MTDESTRAAIEVELERLGLHWESLPGAGLAGQAGFLTPFLKQLQSLNPGVTWHDVFPDLPKHWIAGQPDTWTMPFKPIGPWDYQELPASPALFVLCADLTATENRIQELLAAANEHGFSTHGAGVLARFPEQAVVSVVLPRGTSEDSTWELADWIDSRPGWRLGGCSRTGTEEFVTE